MESAKIERIDGIDFYKIKPEDGQILIISYDMDKLDLSTIDQVYQQVLQKIPDMFKNKFIVIPKDMPLDIITRDQLAVIIKTLEDMYNEQE